MWEWKLEYYSGRLEWGGSNTAAAVCCQPNVKDTAVRLNAARSRTRIYHGGVSITITNDVLTRLPR